MDKKEISDERKIELLETIYGVPKSIWPKIYWDLCPNNWPKELGEKPENSAEESHYLAEEILKRIGEKSVMRYLNVSSGNMTDQLFDDFWDSSKDNAKYKLDSNCADNAKDSTDQSAYNGNRPIMTKLIPFLLGSICGLLTVITILLLEFL